MKTRIDLRKHLASDAGRAMIALGAVDGVERPLLELVTRCDSAGRLPGRPASIVARRAGTALHGGIMAPKAYKGLAMEGAIASWYARNTGRDLGRFTKAAASIAERLGGRADVLEIAPGPGYLAIELARRGYRVAAVDISTSFVEIARRNAEQAEVRIDFREGDAAHLPFSDASFDFVVCMAAFKNFSDPRGALDEMHRVLRPGRKAAIFDLRKDASPEEIAAEVRTMRMSACDAMLTRWTFRHMLLRRAYTSAEMLRMAAESPFGAGEIVPDGIGFELRLAK